MLVMASSPSRAGVTSSTSGSCESSVVSRSRASGSSSTTRTLIFFMIGPSARWRSGHDLDGRRRVVPLDAVRGRTGRRGGHTADVAATAPRLAPWQGDDDREPLRQAMKFEAIVGAEEMLQAGPRRRYADALVQRRQRILGQPDPVVPHLETELVAVAAR